MSGTGFPPLVEPAPTSAASVPVPFEGAVQGPSLLNSFLSTGSGVWHYSYEGHELLNTEPDLEVREVAQDLIVLLINAQGVLVALDRLIIVQICPVYQPASNRRIDRRPLASRSS